jgi:hypothetical protein
MLTISLGGVIAGWNRIDVFQFIVAFASHVYRVPIAA